MRYYCKQSAGYSSTSIIIIIFTCVEHLGGTGEGASLVLATVAYWTGTSAGGGAAGPLVEWETSAYTGPCFMVTGVCVEQNYSRKMCV